MALQAPLSSLITDKHTSRWQLLDKCQLPRPSEALMTTHSEFPDPGMRWLRSWPQDSGPHLAVIKDAETLVCDEECKVGSLITRGGIADITLHLTLVMTNSLRVNPASSSEFLVILGFCTRGRGRG